MRRGGEDPRVEIALERQEPGPRAISPGVSALIDAVALVILVACIPALLFGGGVLRGAVVLAAASFVPGWAVITHLPRPDLLTSLALSVALSLALVIVGSQLLGWLRLWHPVVFGVVLGTAAAVLLLAGLRSTVRTLAADRRLDSQ